MSKTVDLSLKAAINDATGRQRWLAPVWFQGDWCVRDKGRQPLFLDATGHLAIAGSFSARSRPT